jgi:hypothetical protein
MFFLRMLIELGIAIVFHENWLLFIQFGTDRHLRAGSNIKMGLSFILPYRNC